MARCLVVIRHLPTYQPVFHLLVQTIGGLNEVSEQEMMTAAQNDVDAFKKQFVEFNSAQFHYQWIDNLDGCMTVLDMDQGKVVVKPKRS